MMLFAVLAGLAGCQREDEITAYRVPRLEPAAAKAEPVRFLGAIVPDKEESWFFKLVGPEEAVTPQIEPFEKFVKSIRLTGKAEPPIAWELPAGWEQHPGVSLERQGIKITTFATIKIKHDPEPLELAVSKATGTVINNVNRWRGQIGLRPVAQDALAQETKTLDADGVKVTLVNMVGFSGGDVPPPAPGFDANAPPAPKIGGAGKPPDFTVRMPAGWTEQRPSSSITAKQYDAGKGVQATITILRGNGGGPAANINRWRGQIKLPQASDKELIEASKIIELDAGKALSIDMENPREPSNPRLLGIILLRDDYSWFFKMTGPGEQVAREKNNFEALAKSLRIEK
jgi:hypothetical protein